MMDRIKRALWKIRWYLTNRGLVSTLKRGLQVLRYGRNRPPATPLPGAANGSAANGAVPEAKRAQDVISARFLVYDALRLYTVASSEPRINLHTDSINAGSLYGGVGTAIILAALLAEHRGAKLRIITFAERATEGNVKLILENNGISCTRNIDFVFAPYEGKRAEIEVGSAETFLTTASWGTASALRTVNPKNIIYLLQEDERMFFPFGDNHLRCSDLFATANVRFVINTKLLFDHLVRDGLDNIAKNGRYFEPSFSPKTFFPAKKTNSAGKKRFFFYARPNNLRNLYFRGLEAIDLAVAKGVLDPNEWEINFVGKDQPDLILTGGHKPRLLNYLSWDQYGALVRDMDVGLCLMYTPHPSYPPLDLAACGAVVVTNRFPGKSSLDNYSKNILCVDTDIDSLVEGIAQAIKLAANTEQRQRNFQENGLGRDWYASFAPILHWLDGE